MNGSASQSALDTAGKGAEKISELFYWMAGGASVIWIVVIGLVIYAIYSRREHPLRMTRWLVIGGGAVVPVIVLTLLLSYGLALLPDLQRPAPAGSPVIEVVGVRWWWRVIYRDAAGDRIETANEIYLPVDQPVEFQLTSEDVIHSFWIPTLGGKVDMMPGRTTRLKLHPTQEGVFSGVCAEYCGTAHSQMRFRVVVTDQASFEEWLVKQGNDLAVPRDRSGGSGPERLLPDATSAPTAQGEQVFLSRGCSACHAIRGTSADGSVGPDLTHFGSRLSIAAGVLDNTPENLALWLEDTHGVKPGVEMPEFEALCDTEIDFLVQFLGSLQ
ncbi:Cytochrome c oxidase subunit 2 precursor [Roseimaritima multifibrata]|uniref:Cytochrome aa3 subunit 2 n=1 Tax=Roseimaritima multifibrata TaxID=1930274 RepID=A0A517MDD3_9BACT|nr:cytochrome c oxidase subunit II [Roseimaritima multifibrata]QDS92836.1 Cytochrome c oxidase subunit 2 precursor [Roseimaritima multifibrata]